MAMLLGLHTAPVASALLQTRRSSSGGVRLRCLPVACHSSASFSSPDSTVEGVSKASRAAPATNNPFLDPTARPKPGDNYKLAADTGSSSSSAILRLTLSTESIIERVIFDFRFLALLAVGGSLAGSLLCFMNEISQDAKVGVYLGRLRAATGHA